MWSADRVSYCSCYRFCRNAVEQFPLLLVLLLKYVLSMVCFSHNQMTLLLHQVAYQCSDHQILH